jgi:hypothetical protein
MELLLAGTSPQSAAAMEIVAGGVHPDLKTLVIPRGNQPGLPADSAATRRCQLCVLDLVGLGLARWSAQRQADLLEFLADRPAALLVPANLDSSGSAPGWSQLASPRLLLLPQPVQTAHMREALLQLRAQASHSQPTAGTLQAAPSMRSAPALPTADLPPTVAVPEPADATPTQAARTVPPEPTTPPPPLVPPVPSAAPRPVASWTQDINTPARSATPSMAQALFALANTGNRHWELDLDLPLLQEPLEPEDLLTTIPAVLHPEIERYAPMEAAPNPPATELKPRPCGLNEFGYASLLAACPGIGSVPYLVLVADVAMRDTATGLQVSTHTATVFCPQENWVASNVSTAFRKRLTQHKLMLHLLEVQPLTPDEAMARAQDAVLRGRRANGCRPLDAFLWSLAYCTFEKDVPPFVGDLKFSLHQMPNFPRLPTVPDAFLQLSLACLRQPRSVSGLVKAFGQVDPKLVHLFVICAMVSGMAQPLASRPRPMIADHSAVEPAAMVAPDTLAPAPAPAELGFFKSLLNRLF